MTLQALLLACAPLVALDTAHALITVESHSNPYAIGVVAGKLAHQPRNLAEAVATARALEASGWNFSVGLSQINRANFSRYGLDVQTAFEPCGNLRTMQGILRDCYRGARHRASTQTALRMALSCYYSGNFQTGFQHGYVQRVVAAWKQSANHAKEGF